MPILNNSSLMNNFATIRIIINDDPDDGYTATETFQLEQFCYSRQQSLILSQKNQRARFLRKSLFSMRQTFGILILYLQKTNKIHKFTHIALRVRAKNCKRQFTQRNLARIEHTGSWDHCVSQGSRPQGSPGLRCRESCRSSSRRRALCVLGGTGPATNEVSCQCENYGRQLNGTTFSQLMLWQNKL